MPHALLMVGAIAVEARLVIANRDSAEGLKVSTGVSLIPACPLRSLIKYMVAAPLLRITTLLFPLTLAAVPSTCITARRGAHHGPVIIHVVPDSAWECRMYVPSLLSVIELRSAVFGDERDYGDSYRLSGDDVPGGTYLELS